MTSVETDSERTPDVTHSYMYRTNLRTLINMIESGDWERDANGNVVPATMNPEHKSQVVSCATNSVVEEIPVLDAPEGAVLIWSATDSAIVGENVIRSIHHGTLHLTLKNYTIGHTTMDADAGESFGGKVLSLEMPE